MRLFIAVDLPPWIIRSLDAAQHELPRDKLRPVKLDNLHVTVKFLGDVDPKRAQSIINRLANVEQKGFEAVVKGAGAFPNEEYVRVVWAGCGGKELGELAEKINSALPDFPAEKFTGHITIARVAGKVDLRSFFQKYKDFRFGDFKVEKFYLMESELSPSGPKYSIVAEYGLKK